MNIKVGHLLSLFVICLMALLAPQNLSYSAYAATEDDWWDEDWPYRLPVMVDSSGIASININFSHLFEDLGLSDALLDVRSIRVVPYQNGIPGDEVPYEETYSTLIIDADTLNMDPASSNPYWTVEELFTLNLDEERYTQGTGSVHAHFKYKVNACPKTGFNFYFNDWPIRNWSEYEILIYDVWPEVNDSAVDQTPDLFFFELGGLQNCPIKKINGPSLIMDEWNAVSVSMKPFGGCLQPNTTCLENMRFFAQLSTPPITTGFFGAGDEFDVWLDNFRLVDQDGSGQIRWQANQNADKYYIYFDTLNHEGHPLPKFATLGEPFINATAGTPEAGGYFHQITNAEPYGLSVWTAPIEEKILPNAKAPVSSQPLKIYAARGEFESFQIIVNSPFTTSLKVNISDLTNKSASINANQIELFRLDYIEISTISDQFGRLGSWPDPLYPIRFGDKITFSAKKNQPLWFRIKVPYEAMPGVYSGCVSIGSATIPISLELWDFSMPQDIFFDTEFGFDWDTVMEVYGGTKSGVKDKCYDTVKEAMEAAFLDYHISPLPSGTIPPEDDLVYSLTNYEVFLAHQQQIAYSTRVWWEFVFSDYPPFPNPAVIDRPGLDARVLPWMAWLNRVDGIYYPESADWDPDPWSLIFSNSKSNGDSFLFYPPKDDTLAYDPCEVISSRLVPSMRLELLREGLEDYAYLLLLNGRLPELAKENPSDILAKSFIGSRSAFNRVPTTIESLRLQIAEYILTQETKKIYLPFISH